MIDLEPRRFALATGGLLVAATALLGLGAERLARGATTLAYPLLGLGVLATVAAFTLGVRGRGEQATLLLLTRDECPHCDEARAILRHLQDELGFHLWEVRVDEQPELQQQYSDQVPVLVHDGREVASLEVREQDVRGLFERAEDPGAPGGHTA